MNKDKQNKGLCKFLILGLWSLLKAINGFVEFAHHNLLALTNLGGRVIYTSSWRMPFKNALLTSTC